MVSTEIHTTATIYFSVRNKRSHQNIYLYVYTSYNSGTYMLQQITYTYTADNTAILCYTYIITKDIYAIYIYIQQTLQHICYVYVQHVVQLVSKPINMSARTYVTCTLIDCLPVN